ncbi:immunoglobulin-like domain-containing protein, partial [Leuconostoc suionicum]|uniref:immunoglobulin-like domain-containing protein n=1 Tax=Leuconostoc suionicum TaxID=1511761 RepID=UPI00233EA982
ITVTVVDSKAAINAKDSTLTAGPNTKWSAEDNFTSATDQDGNSVDFKDVQVEGQVDTTKAGQYPVTYKYTDASGNPVSKTITVTVTPANHQPAITSGDNITVQAGNTFDPNTGMSATDKEDGNLTDKVQTTITDKTGQVVTAEEAAKTPGSYTVTYSVTDKDGLTTTASKSIIVEEAAKPVT